MSAHDHATRLTTHRVTYERTPNEILEDVYVVCVDCLAELGLKCELVHYPFDELEELPPEDVWEIAEWYPDEYPYDPDARPGDVCYRPDAGWPPSMREVWFRRGIEAKA